MQEVINSFEEKVNEVDLFFIGLKNLYLPDAELVVTDENGEEMSLGAIDTDFLKILKSNALLMIYNLVESSIREGILEIYRDMEINNYSFDKVRDEIRDIWINYHYRNVFDHSANFVSYRNQAKKLVEMAINQNTIKLDRKAIGISGNLDADQIRFICDLHGIKKTVDPASKGGAKLLIVKDQRNALAHGSLSFVECGRTFTVTALSEIKNEAVLFVRSILNNMKEYLENGQYDESRVST